MKYKTHYTHFSVFLRLFHEVKMNLYATNSINLFVLQPVVIVKNH